MAVSMIAPRVLPKYFSFISRNYYASSKLNLLSSSLTSYNVTERRNYNRGKFIRKPLKVTIPGEVDEPRVEKSRKLPEKGYLRPIEEQEYHDDDSPAVSHYIKLKDDNSMFTRLMTLSKNRKYREKNRLILLEGKILIKEALEAGVKPEAIFFSLEENIADLPLSNHKHLKIYKVMYKQLQIWSTLTTSPGVIGIFKLPTDLDVKIAEKNQPKLPLTVVCDNIREPGNLGAIIRCVIASGCTKVLLTKGCVDMWEPKVLRAASGAHFRIPMINNLEWPLMNNYISQNAEIYLAENNIPSTENSDKYVKIAEDVDPGWYEVNENNQVFNPPKESKFTKKPVTTIYPINTVSYDELRVDSSRDTVLVIGGETCGLSEECYQFALRRNGYKLTIPLANGVESLNASVAAGIIIYELLRQIRMVNKE
ncbi:hypothetical protein CHUAL_005707 [Chamberlinius hualienensis]